METMWSKVKEFNKLFGIKSKSTHELSELNESVEFFSALTKSISILSELSGVDSISNRGLRIKLLSEEVSEYLNAELTDDLVEIVDGLTDIHYIAAGTEDVYGIDGEEVFNHVHENNLSKVGPNGEVLRRKDGKIIKPDTFVPVDIAGILNGMTND